MEGRGEERGTHKFSNSALASEPSWIASMIARVALSGQRFPVPNFPPVHPVLTSCAKSAFCFRRTKRNEEKTYPALGTTLDHALGEHGGVARGVKNDEGLSEAGGESGRRLGDAVLGSRGLRSVVVRTPAPKRTQERRTYLGGVAGKEPVLSLVGGEEGDGGEDTEGVASELKTCAR